MGTSKIFASAFFCGALAGCTFLAGVDDIEYGAEETTTSPTTPSGSANPEAPATGGGPTSGPTTTDAGAQPLADAGVLGDATADAANPNPDPEPPVVVPDPDPVPDPVPVADNCTAALFAANDKRGALELRLVTFPALPAAAAKYSPSCMRIKAGQSVTFAGNFAIFPLAPMGQGAAASPIAPTAAGATASFTFAAKGRYSFGSVATPTLRGAIDVK